MEPALTCAFYDVPCHASWLVLQMQAFGNWLYALFLQGAASLIGSVPVPEFLANIQTIILPSGISFFLEPFNLEYGIGILTAAYIARFTVRRIPIIG
jgi:hypothetical protein